MSLSKEIYSKSLCGPIPYEDWKEIYLAGMKEALSKATDIVLVDKVVTPKSFYHEQYNQALQHTVDKIKDVINEYRI